jgi:histidinol phosphate phosphatase hisN-like protein
MECAVPAPSRDDLREHLVAGRIAGSVQTPARDVLYKAQQVADGDPRHCFGLSGLDRYTQAEVLEQVRAQFGWTPTPGEPEEAPTWIDPDLLLAELDRAAERLALAGREGQRVLLASGHPTGVMALHQQVAQALRAAGAKLLRPADGRGFVFEERPRMIRYVLDVAVLSSGANLYHTHAAEPMELVLAQVDEVDLVVGDHGFAGAAAERGIDVVGIADINDPALPMARAEGRAGVVLGMDDNVLPRHYDPLAEYLTAGLGPGRP